ncbi:MAG: PHP domain-containing protein [Actinophytocola sp.]|nr:PHP domain-containing protein [Actinophytocola sp.]
MSPRIDLHTHSTASDGTDSPTDLVVAAAAAEIDVLAITDHDTTAGWREASAALPPGMTLVPGAELSCVSESGAGGANTAGRRISVHLLAYLFDPNAEGVVTEQRRLRAERRSRLRTMAERMAADGVPIDPDELLGALPADAPAGRPHLARALIDAGLASSVDEAFASYLGGGRGYYVPRSDTPVLRAIDMINDAGGVTVLAHPLAYSRGPTVSLATIAEMAAHGLTGIEVDHPNHDQPTREKLRALAAELDLLPTGSSDYHGTNKDIPLGAETTDPDVFADLVSRATGCGVVAGAAG